jgi:GntR family transcriptional regulator, transcriptional repressor for pyruvate dehydrogenase complex
VSTDKAEREGAAGLKTIKRIQRSAAVRNQLEAAIRRGDFAAGDRLPSERELVETFGVSRVSVREAIRSLEALGHVSVQHGRGVFVTDRRSSVGEPMARWIEVHRDERIELLDVRAALDTLAVGQAVLRYRPTEIEGIEDAHAAFQGAVERKAPTSEVVELDGRFHNAIATASGNRLLCDLLLDLTDYLSEYRRLSLAPEGRPAKSLAEHTGIMEAILCRDADRARSAMAAHLASVREYWIRDET